MTDQICSMDDCEKTVNARGYCSMHYRRFRRYGDPSMLARERLSGSPEDRFWKSFERTAECWTWKKRIYSNGYGSHSVKGVDKLAHRYAYELLVGPIPERKQLDHACHNRACVNPGHLRVVTNKQNNENPAGVRSDNTTGYAGVYLNRQTGRFYSKVQHNGKTHSSGGHPTAKEAAEAAKQLRLSLFTHNDLDRASGTLDEHVEAAAKAIAGRQGYRYAGLSIADKNFYRESATAALAAVNNIMNTKRRKRP